MQLRPTSGSLLLSAACDVRDRHLRLLHGVHDLQRTGDLGARELLKEVARRIEALLESFEIKIATTLSGRDLEDFPNNPDQWTPEYQKRWWDVTGNGFRELSSIHRDFLRHVTSGVVPPADIGYFLARGTSLSPTRPSHRRKFALSNSQYSSWESAKVAADASVPAIPIPYVETLTPLRWPLLLHELGHHLLPVTEERRLSAEDDPQRLVDESVGTDGASGRRFDLAEVVADRVAERFCGTAPYTLALVREAQLASMTRHLEEDAAPQLIERLQVLDYWDVLEDVLPTPWRTNLGRSDRTLISERTTAVAAMLPAEGAREDVVSEIVKLLAAYEPASAINQYEQPTDFELWSASNHSDSGISAEQIDALFRLAAHTCCTEAEILSAAWHIEACLPATDYLDTISRTLIADGTLDSEQVRLRRDELARRDTAVSRSLQAAAVHRWLLDHDEVIQRTVTASSTAPLEPDPTSTPGEPAAESSPLADVQLLRRLTRSGDDRQRLVVRPLVDPSQIGGTTIDLRLGTEWETTRTSRFQALNPTDDLEDITTLLDSSVEQFRLTSGQNEGLVLHPGELMLALTLEYLRLPDDLWGNLEGRSTWARIGLQVHASAGMVDAGFDGYLTLELQNTSRLPLVLYPGLRVAQMAFFPVPGVARVYRRKAGAAYSDQTSARTAFPRQHEHEALRGFHRNERKAEQRYDDRRR